MSNAKSRTQTNGFLWKERRSVEELRLEWGQEIVAKIDRFVLRDLVYERKERKLAAWVGPGLEPETPRHRVMISMAGGRATGPVTRRPPSQRDRRRHLDLRKRAAALQLGRLRKAFEQMNAAIEQQFWINRSVVSTLTSDQLREVAERADVRRISTMKLQPALCLDVSRPLIRADEVENNLGFDGSGVNVAILDTGVDAGHVALSAVVVSQQDFTGEGTGDNHGHGTHCAGIVASQDRIRRGVAPGARIWDLKILDQNGNTNAGWATAGIQAAVAAGVDVASNSWGFSHANGNWVDPDGTCVLCQAADAAMDAGVTFVVAAGNENNDTCATYDTHIRCPGIARSVITVGASDDNDDMAGFSSIGPTPDGRIKPDVTAPGVDIVSARAGGTSMGSPVDANWTSGGGTSMACPHVAGVAALMLHKDGTTTPATIKSLLMSTAVDIGAVPNEMGAGRVEAADAVNSV